MNQPNDSGFQPPDNPGGETSAQRPASDSKNPGLLIVDDDEQVRRLLEVTLEPNGFQVWASASGQSAVEQFRNHQRSIVLALIDLYMPNRNGIETLRSLRAIDPTLCCCFITGGGPDYSVEELFGNEAAIVFHKPFDLRHMTRALRHLVFGSLDPSETAPDFVRIQERRRFPRWDGTARDITLTDDRGGEFAGTIVNRSLGGFGIRTERTLDPGDLVIVRSTATPFEKSIPLEVLHRRQIGDGWYCGCRVTSPATLGILSLYS